MIELQKQFQTKLCYLCRKSKPVSEFYPDPRYDLGLSPKCKACTKAQTLAAKKTFRNGPHRPFVSKACTICKVEKPPDAFSFAPSASDGRSSRCKECRRITERLTPETRDERSRRSRLARYALSPDDFERILAEQERKCACCGCRMNRIYIDHCHTTGKMRALVCCRCNTGLCYIEDSKFLKAARKYLKLFE